MNGARGPWFSSLRGLGVFLRKPHVQKNVYGAVRRRNWTQARIWMGWSKPAPTSAVRPDYLDAAADIFAVAKVYDDQGDPDLLRRVEARIIRDGYTVEQVRERVREKANAAISGAGNSQEPSS